MQRSAVNSGTTSNSVIIYPESGSEPTKQKISDLGQEWANECSSAFLLPFDDFCL